MEAKNFQNFLEAWLMLFASCEKDLLIPPMTQKRPLQRKKRKQHLNNSKIIPLSPKKRVKDHLLELRKRVFICFIFFILFSVLSYTWHETLINVLLAPFGESIFFTSPAGGFSLLINISLLFGFLLTIPIVIYHLFSFISPVFSEKWNGSLVLFVGASSILLICGVCFAYFVCLPAAFAFLGGFGTNQVQPLVTSHEYFAFVSRYLLGFGLIFQLPLVILIIDFIYPLQIKTLFRISSYVVLISFIISAILTPTPDPVNQSIMAIPIILLYYISVVFLYVRKRS